MSVNRLIFGTASAGSRLSYSEFSKTASMACSLGISLFDTAPTYGRGLSQKYLAKFIKSNPSFDIQVMTKVGRAVRIDVKTLLIYLLRLDLSPIFSGMVVFTSPSFCLSEKRVRTAKIQLDKWFSDSDIYSILIHSPEKEKITPTLLTRIETITKANGSIGCSEPSSSNYEFLKAYHGRDFVVQVSYAEFIKRVDYQAHPGHLVVNGILRFSRANAIPLSDIFCSIDQIRNGKKTSFNFGFYSCEILNDIVKSYKDYTASERLFQ